MPRRRYLDESRPSMDYVRAMINNTDPETGRVNYEAIDVPWNSTPTRRRTTNTKKKNNTKWVPKTKEQALKSLGETKEYIVGANDTLSKIDSKRWRDIAIANGISDPNKIQVGQKLIIPKDAGAPSESAASESTKTKDVNTPTPKTTDKRLISGATSRARAFSDQVMSRDTTAKDTSVPKSTSANQDYGAAKIGLFTTPNIVPPASEPTQEKSSSNLSTRVQNRIAALRQYAKDNGIDLSKPEEKSAARRGWDAFINSFVPSVNADPSGGYHAYTNEQFWKDNTREEMPGALRQTVGQNLKVAGAAAASIGAPAALETLGATVGAPISDAIMATRGGQIVGNVLANPYVRAAGTAYGLSRLPFDTRDGDYINAALDVVPFGAEAWNAARSIATGTNMTGAGNWFGFSKNINPGGTRVSNPISVNAATTKIPFKPTTATTQTRFPIWYLRGKMPMYNPYTGTTEFVNSSILGSVGPRRLATARPKQTYVEPEVNAMSWDGGGFYNIRGVGEPRVNFRYPDNVVMLNENALTNAKPKVTPSPKVKPVEKPTNQKVNTTPENNARPNKNSSSSNKNNSKQNKNNNQRTMKDVRRGRRKSLGGTIPLW